MLLFIFHIEWRKKKYNWQKKRKKNDIQFNCVSMCSYVSHWLNWIYNSHQIENFKCVLTFQIKEYQLNIFNDFFSSSLLFNRSNKKQNALLLVFEIFLTIVTLSVTSEVNHLCDSPVYWNTNNVNNLSKVCRLYSQMRWDVEWKRVGDGLLRMLNNRKFFY